jgi:hypothetical protein
LTEEIYEVQVSDAEAKEIEKFKDNKQELADLVDDAQQRATRRCEPVAKHIINDVNDTVTYVKLKVENVKE